MRTAVAVLLLVGILVCVSAPMLASQFTSVDTGMKDDDAVVSTAKPTIDPWEAIYIIYGMWYRLHMSFIGCPMD